MRAPKTLAILASLFVGLSQAADPPASPIILPVIEAPKEKDPPAPPPGSPVILVPDSQYVIQSSVECLVFPANNNGVIKVTKDTGPLRIKGRFAEKPYEIQTKNFTAKFLYIVEGGVEGTEGLIVSPVGAKTEAEAKRVQFQVGQMPIPPPKPPKPDDPVVPVKSFRVIFVYESGDTYTAAQNGVLYGKAVQDYLTAKTTPEGGLAGWRRYDKDVTTANEQPIMAALWTAVKPKLTVIPCMVVEVNGKAEILALPANSTEALATLKKYGGQ